jgi:hypothetical protein
MNDFLLALNRRLSLTGLHSDYHQKAVIPWLAYPSVRRKVLAAQWATLLALQSPDESMIDIALGIQYQPFLHQL